MRWRTNWDMPSWTGAKRRGTGRTITQHSRSWAHGQSLRKLYHPTYGHHLKERRTRIHSYTRKKEQISVARTGGGGEERVFRSYAHSDFSASVLTCSTDGRTLGLTFSLNDSTSSSRSHHLQDADQRITNVSICLLLTPMSSSVSCVSSSLRKQDASSEDRIL